MIRDFCEELMSMCSASNTKSRGFYIFVTIALAIVTILIPVLLILNIVMLIKGWWTFFYLLLLLAAIGGDAGVIFWLSRK